MQAQIEANVLFLPRLDENDPFAHLREIKNNPDCAAYVRGKELTFQIQTKDGEGRHFMLRNAKVTSQAGLTRNAAFTMMFCDAARGFSILSAKDSQTAFLRGVGNGDLLLSGDFAEIMID